MVHHFIILLRKIHFTEWKISRIITDNFIMYSGNVCRVLFQETRNINFPDRTTYLKWCMLMPSMMSICVSYCIDNARFPSHLLNPYFNFFFKNKRRISFCVWLLEKFSLTERLDKNFIFNVKMTLWL